jgi:putative transposase
MGHPLRMFVPDVSVHVIRRGNNRCTIAKDDADFLELLRTLRFASHQFDVAVHGYVIMTNHYHLIATPAREHALPLMMKTVGERYVRYFNARYDRIGTLWSGRYNAIAIDSEIYFLTCLRYIEQNPWRASMVETADSYEWSSCRAHAFGQRIDWLAPHAAYLALGEDSKEREAAYRAICAVALTDDELAEQRHPPRRTKVSDVSDTFPESEMVSDVSDTSC